MFWQSLFLITISLTSIVDSYIEPLNAYALNISQATYCIESVWNCKTCANSIMLNDNIENNGVKVLNAIDHDNEYIIVSFRGSTNIQNWIDNLQISHIQPYDSYQEVSVDKGFYKALSDVREPLYDSTMNLINKYSSYNVLITGHSLGSALSTLCAFELIYLNNVDSSIIRLITFGSPRVGNDAFKKYMSIISISWRTTHYYDIVPHVPEEFLNYIHISQEIWYNRPNSDFKLCDDDYEEDSSCSNSCAPTKCTSVDDHMYYLNISMGTNGLC
jgi:predicted lipase